MARRYPCIGSGPDVRPPKGQACENCGDKATRGVWIEYTYMRGDDERTWVCEACNTRAHKNCAGFVKSCHARFRALNGEGAS